jgi:hypothetical protein
LLLLLRLLLLLLQRIEGLLPVGYATNGSLDISTKGSVDVPILVEIVIVVFVPNLILDWWYLLSGTQVLLGSHFVDVLLQAVTETSIVVCPSPLSNEVESEQFGLIQ